ncbi:MAG TPA: VWA domain-containing protein [Candidatus Hydrogenedentes bacterium]|nr:VWA domain-containing protein [Candidatus Hydrogenedentota bacterium]HPG67423.1 VWA domain-containing protein [Candidatus Hydrogenedentota bacterium]
MKVGFIFPFRELHWWLGLAVIVMAVVVVGLRAFERRRRGRLARFVDASLAPRLLLGYDAAVRRPLFWLPVFGIAAMALVFAQPHWGQAWRQIRKQSHDIVICLDTSESMRAANPLPTRMERARQKIGSLVDRASGDRFALVAFSGAASLQCPLTLDHGYFKAVLGAVNTDTVSAEGTDIAEALRAAVDTFKAEAEQSGVWNRDTRAILLISDGEQVSGDAIEEAEKASEYARVYVIGVGDPNGAEITLPEWMGQYTDGKRVDKTHLSRLDEETLEKVGLAGKGGYIRTTPDNGDVNQIYDHLTSLTARTVSSDVRLRLVNRYQWPLAVAILCFAGEGLWLALMPWIRRWRMRRELGVEAEQNHV